jgi:hypothetical protein
MVQEAKQYQLITWKVWSRLGMWLIMDQTQMAKNVFESKPGNGGKGKKEGE